MGSATDSYAATSILMHELVHGLGIYSLLRSASTSAFMNKVSVYDAHMKFESDTTHVFGTDESVAQISGGSLAGKSITVGGQRVHNPAIYDSGSSLSHFEGDTLLSHAVGPGECTFKLGVAEVMGLNAIGWNCDIVKADDHSWTGAHAKIEFTGGEQNHVSTACGCTSDAACGVGGCCSAASHCCVACDEITDNDTAVILVMAITFGVCIVMALFVIANAEASPVQYVKIPTSSTPTASTAVAIPATSIDEISFTPFRC